MEWQRVRTLTLTIDPSQWSSGQEAFEHIRDHKALSQMIKNLKRGDGYRITDYLWVLEWHTNGFPHWHVFIEVEKKGKAGMIDFKHTDARWAYGASHDGYIHNQEHWERYLSYVEKKGYFGKGEKESQLELPEWALEVEYRIRKWSASQTKGKTENGKENDEDIDEKGKDRVGVPDVGLSVHNECTIESKGRGRTYRDRLSRCGRYTLCCIRRNHWQKAIYKRYAIPYQSFKELGGEWEPGTGWVIQMSMENFRQFDQIMGLIKGEDFAKKEN